MKYYALHELHSLMQEGKVATICSCNQEDFFHVPLLPLMLNNPHPFIYQLRQSCIPHAYYDLFTEALSSCSVVSCVISPHFVSNVKGSMFNISPVHGLQATILFQNPCKSKVFPH